jgi:DNA-directed RNA polymerase subunit L
MSYTIDFKDTCLSYINGIRRTLLTDLPILGFVGEILDDGTESTIDILINTGPLNNEILKNRICQIPICFKDTELDDTNEDEFEFELYMENTGNNILNVSSDDIIIKHKDIIKTAYYKYLFPKDPISKNNILITRLRKNEKLHFIAKMHRNTARIHAGFCPVSGVGYYFVPLTDKKIGDKIDQEGEMRVDEIYLERNYKKNEYGEPTDVKFNFESVNNYSGEYLIKTSIHIIINKLEKIKNALKGENDDKKLLEFKAVNNTSYEFIFSEEDDTIGNILQSYIHNKYVRVQDKKCTYIGYVCVHPLQYTMNLRITLPLASKDAEYIEFLYNNITNIIGELNELNDLIKIKIV